MTAPVGPTRGIALAVAALILCLESPFARAGEVESGGPDVAAVEPGILLKALNSLDAAALPGLAAVAPTLEEPNSYHLTDACYCGYFMRDGEVFHVVSLLFRRSSNLGSAWPPARGHGFLVIFDNTPAPISHSRAPFGRYRMAADGKLMDGDEVWVDFGNTPPAVRRFGWLIDGSDFLPYPFEDAISEEEWEAGNFSDDAGSR